MLDSLSFKVFLQDQENEEEKEVRRFEVEKNISNNFSSLKLKLCDVFPEIRQKMFSICWCDKDGDMVTIGSDEELDIALTDMSAPVYKLTITLKSQKRNVKFEESGNLYRSDDCYLCKAYAAGGPHNMKTFPNPEIVYPKKLLKQIAKMRKIAEKSQAHQKNDMLDVTGVRAGTPPYFGFDGHGLGMFKGSVRSRFRGRQGLDDLHYRLGAA